MYIVPYPMTAALITDKYCIRTNTMSVKRKVLQLYCNEISDAENIVITGLIQAEVDSECWSVDARKIRCRCVPSLVAPTSVSLLRRIPDGCIRYLGEPWEPRLSCRRGECFLIFLPGRGPLRH